MLSEDNWEYNFILLFDSNLKLNIFLLSLIELMEVLAYSYLIIKLLVSLLNISSFIIILLRLIFFFDIFILSLVLISNKPLIDSNGILSPKNTFINGIFL